MTTDQELMSCRDCRVWDPDNQPSVLAKLQADPNAYADRWFKWVFNGMTLGLVNGCKIPLSTELILCKKHEELEVAACQTSTQKP